MNISRESLRQLRCVASEMEGTAFHLHTHILYDMRSTLGVERKKYLEIGCAYGMTTCLMLSHPFPTDCVAVDLGIPETIEGIVNLNVKRHTFEGNTFKYIKGDSRSGKTILEVIKESTKYDMVFIDGDHTKRGVLSDFQNYADLVEIGGYLIFDDYLDQWDCPDVRKAVDEIVRNYGSSFEIIGCLDYDFLNEFTHLEKNNLFIMRKVSDIGFKSGVRFLKEEGYLILRNFFPKQKIENLRLAAQNIFEIQFNKRNYQGNFKEKMVRLFREEEDVFINCGKIIQQGLIELYQISVDNSLIMQLKNLGLDFPNLCTRPVLFFNNPDLAKEEVYYKTPLHQDWPSMQSSSDSLVVWIPLLDVDAENGSILIYPGSHKYGDLSNSVEGGFAKIDGFDSSRFSEIQPELKVGDIAIFSTFLVHKSGDILDDSIRWSCHFRYTNMLDQDFIDRGFPNPYIYKPVIKDN
jgi:ectoine hydroxylase-related dioxygenase (phytanoyl-CoA dioxygenase family)/predicted O-methyltransferase YrrM